jgi:hypothetical protein
VLPGAICPQETEAFPVQLPPLALLEQFPDAEAWMLNIDARSLSHCSRLVTLTQLPSQKSAPDGAEQAA